MASRAPEIVLLTSVSDETADFVEERLVERRVDYIRIDTDHLLEELRLFLDITQPKGTCLEWRSVGYSTDLLKGVLHRRPVTPAAPSLWDPDIAGVASREALCALWSALLVAVGTRGWINAPHAIAQAEYKPEQLKRATELGLVVPPTIVTDRRDDAMGFLSRHPLTVAKAVYEGFAALDAGDTVTWTTVVTEEQLAAAYLAPIPMMFQAAIHPKRDLRIVVIDDSLWCAEIQYAEDDRPSRLDWRAAPDGSRSVPCPIDTAVADRLLALVASYGLRFAAIDMVRAQDGNLYFLELNASGQWGWLELEARFPLRDALIDALLKAADYEPPQAHSGLL